MASHSLLQIEAMSDFVRTYLLAGGDEFVAMDDEDDEDAAALPDHVCSEVFDVLPGVGDAPVIAEAPHDA